MLQLPAPARLRQRGAEPLPAGHAIGEYETLAEPDRPDQDRRHHRGQQGDDGAGRASRSSPRSTTRFPSSGGRGQHRRVRSARPARRQGGRVRGSAEGPRSCCSSTVDLGPLGTSQHLQRHRHAATRPSDLVGKHVAVFANLKPRKMRFGAQRGHGPGRRRVRRRDHRARARPAGAAGREDHADASRPTSGRPDGTVAVRRPEAPDGAWAGDARAEAFSLRFEDGREGRAVLGLERQEVDAASADDPDLVHAVRCWLAARGTRCDEPGRRRRAGDRPGGDSTSTQLGTLRTTPPRGPVVTLAPSNAELVDALGCFDWVVACEDSSDFPPGVAECERLGPDLGPDLDRVAALAPALVVSSLSVPGMERVVTGLRARGLPQVVLAPRSLAEVIDDVRRVGDRVGRAEAAARVVDRHAGPARGPRGAPVPPARFASTSSGGPSRCSPRGPTATATS